MGIGARARHPRGPPLSPRPWLKIAISEGSLGRKPGILGLAEPSPMNRSALFASSMLVALAAFVASPPRASAMTWYVSPNVPPPPDGGAPATDCSSRAAACDLGTAAAGAMAGDTVILMDGVYKNVQLYVANSGTASAWITFQADDCAVPIIEGPGVGPTDTNQDSGVGSSVATYVKFVGIVSRGWSSGFTNGWTGTDTTTSNGHFEYDYCVADGNGRTGITFFSAQGIKVKNSIIAHNGSSTAESWSSGVTLYEAQGSAGDSWIEGNVSFENMDGQKHTDGSGFIIDEYSNGATFINNIAFRNGGSCLRLTKSMNCKFINNTCYHDAQDTMDTGPSNPSEVYFTKDNNNSTTTGTTFMNNVFVATGTGPGMTAIYNQPTSGWANNQTSTGTVSYFTSADGTNPTFTLASGSTLVGKGGTGSSVPTNDIGFDPKCITKQTPVMVGMMAKGSWWQYSVDINYIKSIGGVAQCFHAKNRSGTPDIGAYANGTVSTTTAGSCTPPPITGAGGSGGGAGGAGPGAGGRGGASGSGAAGAGAAGSTGAGGGGTGAAGAAGGRAGTSGGGAGGGNSSGASGATGAGGTIASGSGGSSAGGTSPGSAGTGTGSGATGGTTAPPGAQMPGGCSCAVASSSPRALALAGLGLLGIALLARRRRR
jgi:MYXO-CTERM domain-containing protein